MEHLKQKRWYKITVYLLVAVCIRGLLCLMLSKSVQPRLNLIVHDGNPVRIK